LALVERLSFSGADTLSMQSLRNQFFDIDTAVQNNSATLINYESRNLSGGFHGFHLVASLGNGSPKMITVDQTSVVNASLSRVYNLLVTCRSTCYEKYKSRIEQVVTSWTVRAG
jgi:hypothetical protein